MLNNLQYRRFCDTQYTYTVHIWYEFLFYVGRSNMGFSEEVNLEPFYLVCWLFDFQLDTETNVGYEQRSKGPGSVPLDKPLIYIKRIEFR